TLAEGAEYGRRSDGFGRVAFAPVTTRALRVVAESWGTGSGGGSVGIREWQVAAADGGTGVPELDVTVETGARCVVGRTVLTARVANGSDVPVTVDVESAFGSRSLSLAPGRQASHAFTTRQTTVEAGTVSVTATATVDGQEVSVPLEADYDAHTCG